MTWLLEVGPKDKMITKIPISGSIDNPDIGITAGVWGLIKNAMFNRFSENIDEASKSNQRSEDESE